jgi:hypothetical protein
LWAPLTNIKFVSGVGASLGTTPNRTLVYYRYSLEECAVIDANNNRLGGKTF